MGETSNIAAVASKITKDIFRPLGWHMHPKCDANFDCLDDGHTGRGGKPKREHPTDVVFSYEDPYLAKRVHLLTDLKSYAADTIKHTKIREALVSLAMSVECAGSSDQWRERFCVVKDEPHEVRGLLFVYNHDRSYEKSFYQELKRVNTKTLPIARGNIIHYLGPVDIQRLVTITTDILRKKGSGELDADFTFFYPDLVMRRRSGDVWGKPATIEALAGPFLMIKHGASEHSTQGYMIYYNRTGETVEEFEYLLDCFSRFQMIESGQSLRIEVCHKDASEDLISNFKTATRKYAKSWGFEEERSKLLDKIEISRVISVVDNYNPGDMGREW